MKLQKNKKHPLNKRLLVALTISSFLMVFSFGITYLNSQPLSTKDYIGCKGVSYTTSADELVVVGEADLKCAGDIERKRSSSEDIKLISVSVGAVSAGLTLILLFLFLKKSF